MRDVLVNGEPISVGSEIKGLPFRGRQAYLIYDDTGYFIGNYPDRDVGDQTTAMIGRDASEASRSLEKIMRKSTRTDPVKESVDDEQADIDRLKREVYTRATRHIDNLEDSLRLFFDQQSEGFGPKAALDTVNYATRNFNSSIDDENDFGNLVNIIKEIENFAELHVLEAANKIAHKYNLQPPLSIADLDVKMVEASRRRRYLNKKARSRRVLNKRAQSNPAQNAKSLLRNIGNLIKELDDLPVEALNPTDIVDAFKSYDKLTSKLARLTYNGELPPDIRSILPKMVKWLDNYEKNISKEEEEGKLLDVTEVEKYKSYAEQLKKYFEETFPKLYEQMEEAAEDIEEKHKIVKKNIKKFMLQDPDVIEPDLLSADDDSRPLGMINLNPPSWLEERAEKVKLVAPKTLKDIKSNIEKLRKFGYKIQVLRKEIEPSLQALVNLDIGEFFELLNKRNDLVRSLLKNLRNLNKILHQGNLENNLLIRTKYEELLDYVLDEYSFLPDKIRSSLMRAKPDRAQRAVERSVGAIRERMDDPVDMRVSPFAASPQMEDKYEELTSDDIIEVSELPEPDDSFEEDAEGDPITEEEKIKYQSLWNVASTSAGNILKYASVFKKAAEKDPLTVKDFVKYHGPYAYKKNEEVFNMCKKHQKDKECKKHMKEFKRLRDLYLEDRDGGKDYNDSMLDKVIKKCKKHCEKLERDKKRQ